MVDKVRITSPDTHTHTCTETITYSDSVCVWVQAVRLGCSCDPSHRWQAMLGHSLVQHVGSWTVLLDLMVSETG